MPIVRLRHLPIRSFAAAGPNRRCRSGRNRQPQNSVHPLLLGPRRSPRHLALARPGRPACLRCPACPGCPARSTPPGYLPSCPAAPVRIPDADWPHPGRSSRPARRAGCPIPARSTASRPLPGADSSRGIPESVRRPRHHVGVPAAVWSPADPRCLTGNPIAPSRRRTRLVAAGVHPIDRWRSRPCRSNRCRSNRRRPFADPAVGRYFLHRCWSRRPARSSGLRQPLPKNRRQRRPVVDRIAQPNPADPRHSRSRYCPPRYPRCRRPEVIPSPLAGHPAPAASGRSIRLRFARSTESQFD